MYVDSSRSNFGRKANTISLIAAARKKAEAAGKSSKAGTESLEELEKKNKLLERNRKLECKSFNLCRIRRTNG